MDGFASCEQLRYQDVFEKITKLLS